MWSRYRPLMTGRVSKPSIWPTGSCSRFSTGWRRGKSRAGGRVIPEAYRGSFELPASSSTVFAHLTMADLIAAWWPDGADTDPAPGGRRHLSGAGAGTTLVDTEHEPGADEERQAYAEGWEFFLGQLREILAAG